MLMDVMSLLRGSLYYEVLQLKKRAEYVQVHVKENENECAYYCHNILMSVGVSVHIT